MSHGYITTFMQTMKTKLIGRLSDFLDDQLFLRLTVACIAILICACADRGQFVDLKADVSVRKPAFSAGAAPRVYIDAAHANFHTATGRYEPLANLLRNDGFTVLENQDVLSDASLKEMDIFVIANADFKADGTSFSSDEIVALKNYVLQGGSLLLIADHTPFPAAIIDLAHAFSIHFFNVFADDGESGLFTRQNGGLTNDALLTGIDQIRTFGGSAFRIDTSSYRPLLKLGAPWTMQVMESSGLSEKESAEGLLQGAVLEVGKGKVAVFGEAAMFSAQRYGKWQKRMGFHARGAADNKHFILNVFHFLA